jgi:outer membrane protein OmpA-like peptidoglycan-associated protein
MSMKSFPFQPGRTRQVLSLAAALCCSAWLAGCQTTPPTNPDLDAARSAVQQAAAAPNAGRAASVDLDRAQQALRRAEAAWADNRDIEETRHLAYLAQRRADTVQAIAAQAQADERVQQAGAERERIRLEARTREADAAARRAQSAQSQAQLAQSQAQLAQQQARAAQGQAQQSQQEADAARMQLQQEQERAAAMERDLQALQAKSTQRGMVVTLGDVLFATGQATLQPGAQRSVQQLAQVLQQYPERRVLIEGFTDSQGGDQMNLELSQRRADAFRQALMNRGVPAERIEVRAHGKAYPVADNATAAGRQQNRRVEVLFSDAKGRFGER